MFSITSSPLILHYTVISPKVPVLTHSLHACGGGGGGSGCAAQGKEDNWYIHGGGCCWASNSRSQPSALDPKSQGQRSSGVEDPHQTQVD